MKKYFFLFACFFAVFAVFAEPQFEFGVGSGYVFYGDKDLKNLLSDFDQKSQVILCGDFSVDFPVAEPVKLVFGMDSIMDARWKGSEHFILWDYCGFAGFKIYPGLAGLCTTIQYCLGRRTDFVSLQDIEDYIESTNFGNGFAFGISYDFGYGKKSYAPEVCANWRHMPRGGSSDNILEVKFRLSKN